MRILLFILFAFALAALPARAAACASAWRVDHSVYDAVLHKQWAVLVNCAHPEDPARMEIISSRDAAGVHAREVERNEKREAAIFAGAISVKAGTAVEVRNAVNGMVSIRMAGTAMQSASIGQTIRVRLNSEGSFVYAIVRGPHVVELAAAGSKPVWRQH